MAAPPVVEPFDVVDIVADVALAAAASESPVVLDTLVVVVDVAMAVPFESAVLADVAALASGSVVVLAAKMVIAQAAVESDTLAIAVDVAVAVPSESAVPAVVLAVTPAV